MAFKSLAFVVAAVVALAAHSASAQENTGPSQPKATTLAPAPKPTFKFGKPTAIGAGCIPNSAAVVPASDGQSASAIFSAFNSVTAGSGRDRKACNLVVPVDVAQGLALGVSRVEYQGSVRVSNRKDASAQSDTEYFFAGQRGPVATKKYDAGTSADVSDTNELPDAATFWSPCGASTNFRVNSAITAITAVTPALGTSDAAQIPIEASGTTVLTGFRYFFKTRPCK